MKEPEALDDAALGTVTGGAGTPQQPTGMTGTDGSFLTCDQGPNPILLGGNPGDEPPEETTADYAYV